MAHILLDILGICIYFFIAFRLPLFSNVQLYCKNVFHFCYSFIALDWYKVLLLLLLLL